LGARTCASTATSSLKQPSSISVLIVSVTGQPIYLSRGSVTLTAVVGVLVRGDGEGDEGSRKWNYAFMLLYTFVTSSAVYSIPVQFYYRYAVLKK